MLEGDLTQQHKCLPGKLKVVSLIPGAKNPQILVFQIVNIEYTITKWLFMYVQTYMKLLHQSAF